MKQLFLVVDDDEAFCGALVSLLKTRGYDAVSAKSMSQVQQKCETLNPEFAIVDLRIGSDSGLKVCEYLLKKFSGIRIVILTGFASIATAVEAIKLGVIQYLTKPTDLDSILKALLQQEANVDLQLPTQPMPVKRLEWEHLQKVLLENDGNISKAAKQLNMHRRTLQRKLQKKPMKNSDEY